MVGVEVSFARQLAFGAELAGVAGQELLDLGARVPHQLASLVPDGERAATVGVQRVVHQACALGVFYASGVEHHRFAVGVLAVAQGPGHVQAAQQVVGAAVARVACGGTAVAKHGGVQQATGGHGVQLGRQVVALAARPAVLVGEVFDAELFHEALAGVARPVGRVGFAPGARVTFVGGDEVGLAADRVGRDAVGLVHAAQAGPGLDVGLQVGVGHVQLITGHAVVFVAQCDHIRHLGGGDVDLGHGIVFLQGDPGRLAVGGHGDVLGLEVLGGRGTGAKDAYSLGAQGRFLAVEGGKGGGAGNWFGGVGHVDHTDRAFGVDLVVVAGLTLVGHQHGAAVGGEGHHVGQSAHHHAAQQRQVAGLVQRHAAVVGFDRGLDGHCDDAVVYGYAVDLGARQHGGGVDAADMHRVCRVGQVEHVHGAQLGIHHEGTFGCGIEGGDFCGAFAEHAGAVAADLLQRQADGGGLGNVITATTGGQRGCSQQGDGEKAERGLRTAQQGHGHCSGFRV